MEAKEAPGDSTGSEGKALSKYIPGNKTKGREVLA